MKLLIVEDDIANRDMLSRRLIRRGFEVVGAADGLQAVELAHSEHPDLILMDISLPELDGLDATRQIRASAETHQIPIIALTAHAFKEDREQCLAAGCNDYDIKPVDLSRLLSKIEAFLGE